MRNGLKIYNLNSKISEHAGKKALGIYKSWHKLKMLQKVCLNMQGNMRDDHFNTNVRGGFFCAQAVAPKMIERGFGRVVFISSQSGLIGIPGQPVYCASKGAIINLVRTLGVEWAKHGITVNSVAPTFVETNPTRARLQQPDFRAFVLGKIPKGELATPEDIAHAVVYLASDEAGMVNCATLPVDGGWTAW